MEWICTINYSEKDYLEFIKREIEDEYCDIVQHVIEEIKKIEILKLNFPVKVKELIHVLTG